MRRFLISLLLSFSLVATFFSVSPAQAVYCWCQDMKSGNCQYAQNNDSLQSLVCGGTDSTGCDVYCKTYNNSPQQDFRAIHCDPNTNFVNWRAKTVDEGGCMLEQCWCHNTTSGSCQSSQKDLQGNIILSQGSCDQYCPSIGQNWQSIHFDNSGTDYSKTNDCAPIKQSAGTNQSNDQQNTANTVADLQQRASEILNPGGFTSATDIIAQAIRVLMGFIGSIALILYIYAGAIWMTAFGNSEKTEKATNVIMWTTLGLVVMMASYLLVSTLFKSFGL